MNKRKAVTIYKNRNAPITIYVRYDDVLIDFIDDNIAKLGIVIKGVEYTSEDGYIEFGNGGVVTFKLNSIQNPPRNPTTGRLIMYRAGDELGEPIFTERSDYEIEFDFA